MISTIQTEPLHSRERLKSGMRHNPHSKDCVELFQDEPIAGKVSVLGRISDSSHLLFALWDKEEDEDVSDRAEGGVEAESTHVPESI